MDKIKENKGILLILFLITMFMNFAFPKAGLKLAGVPLTAGNIMFAITFVLWISEIIRKGKFKINSLHIILFIFILYSILKFSYIIFFKTEKLVNTIGYLIPNIVYPFSFFITYYIIKDKESYEKYINIIKITFYIVSIYAIMQNIFGIGTIDIPGLTVNYTDYKQMGPEWYMKKSNGISEDDMKSVSTYQNGNLFGLALLMIFPIVYDSYKKNKNKSKLKLSLSLFIISELLCLSRACWFGMGLFMIYILFKKNKLDKDKLFKLVIIGIVGIIATMIVILKVPTIYNRIIYSLSLEKLLSMSGRTEGLITFLTNMFDLENIIPILFGPFGINKVEGLAYEMTPLSILNILGIIGLIIWLILFYIIIKNIGNKKNNTYIYRITILVWFLTGLIEGGYWLPPTVLNLFSIIGLGFAVKDNKIDI